MVEDIPALRRTYSRILGKICEVVGTDCGKAAIEAVSKDGDFDVVILDMELGDMGGMDVYNAFADIAPHLLDRIVFASGRPYATRLPNRCLNKPMSVQDLRETVRKVYEELGPRSSAN